ncbi:MAG: TIGR01777 family oxidoreductase [Gemmataceae bacterium]|nr:TIGR01777 family oxidoreductase [Gemmataceae bacterium]
MRVFVTGGTGLVGRRLLGELKAKGHEAVVLTRQDPTGRTDAEYVRGDPTQPGAWQQVAAECDAIINLAGEGIFNRRWNDEFKKLVRDSRILATRHCVEALKKAPRRSDGSPKVLVNASAIGYYGARGPEPLDESAAPGAGFLPSVCVEWELPARAAEADGVRVVLARIGVVLDRHGGALGKMLLPFKLGAGGPIASGKQYMSWIHNADVAGLLVFALENSAVTGPMNVTAPKPVTNKEFGKALGRALGRPALVWTPGFALRIMLGEGAEIITTGQNVLPKKALDLGYAFRFPEIDAALADVLAQPTRAAG